VQICHGPLLKIPKYAKNPDKCPLLRTKRTFSPTLSSAPSVAPLWVHITSSGDFVLFQTLREAPWVGDLPGSTNFFRSRGDNGQRRIPAENQAIRPAPLSWTLDPRLAKGVARDSLSPRRIDGDGASQRALAGGVSLPRVEHDRITRQFRSRRFNSFGRMGRTCSG